MKKFKKTEWEERREHLKAYILPAILEIMKDFFGNEKLYLEMSTQKNGEFITAFASVSDKNGKTTDCVSLHMSVYDNVEEIDRAYNKLAEFLKKYLA
jgi:hypothetical protein